MKFAVRHSSPRSSLKWVHIVFGNNLRYNAFNVYRRELAPGTVSLTGDRAQGDDSKHWAYSSKDLGNIWCEKGKEGVYIRNSQKLYFR